MKRWDIGRSQPLPLSRDSTQAAVRISYCAKCPLANRSHLGCHPPVQNIPSCKVAMETPDQMDFSWQKKTVRTLLISDPGQVLITCHLHPFVSAGDGLLLGSLQQELRPAHSSVLIQDRAQELWITLGRPGSP